MTTSLSASQIAQFQQQGYLAPLAALSAADAVRYLHLLDDAQARGGPAKDREYYKPHLYYPWLYELVSHPALLDAVEGVLGPDLLAWGSALFIKEPGQDQVVHWHQDSLHYGLQPEEAVTAWVAFSESGADNGGLRVIPGSHQRGTVLHEELNSHPGTLFRGSVARGVNEAEAMALNLKPGEMSLHHLRTLHGSLGNHSSKRRVGLAVRYVPAHVRQSGPEDSALLVRGQDRHGHFLPESPPVAEGEPGTVARYEAAMARREKVIFTTNTYIARPENGARL